ARLHAEVLQKRCSHLPSFGTLYGFQRTKSWPLGFSRMENLLSEFTLITNVTNENIMTRSTQKYFSDEDPLACLPRKPLQDFARKRVIYDSQQRAENLYVVISGRVKVSHTAPDGSQTVVRIVPPDGFFGESSLLGAQSDSESAVALENVKTMCWSNTEIEQQIEREPRLGLAL